MPEPTKVRRSARSGATGDQVKRGSNLARRAAEPATRTASSARRGAKNAGQSAREVTDGKPDQALESLQKAAGGGGSDRQFSTVREELLTIVREAAVEVLAPAARKATVQAAKYAITRGPEYATGTLAPKLKENLSPALEEAGGIAPLAKTVLGSIPERGREALDRAGLPRRGGDEESAEKSPSKDKLPIQISMDVAAPLDSVYDEFQRRLTEMKSFRDGEISDAEPDERIEWVGESDTGAKAMISFHSLSDRLTRVMVSYHTQPQGALGKITGAFGGTGRALRGDLSRFKAMTEMAQPEDADDSEGEDYELGHDDGGQEHEGRASGGEETDEDEDDLDEDEDAEDEDAEDEDEDDEAELARDESFADDNEEADDEPAEEQPVARRRSVRRQSQGRQRQTSRR